MKKKILLLLLSACLCTAARATGEKIVKVPDKEMKEYKFGQADGQFDHTHKMESDNLVLFWDKSFGSNPAEYIDQNRRFYPEKILAEGERFFNYYVNKLKFADRFTSQSARYKMIIWMFNDDETTAYGWGNDGVGMMWMRPCRANTYPYCALAHEMGHSFQYMVEADGARGFTGCPLVEYTSQWMLWQVYSEWPTLEKFHLDTYMKQTHYSLFNEVNQYHAPQFMEYWSNKHGLDIIARIWKEAQGKEDPVQTYQRLTGLTQEQFNDEIYDAATRFITWDVPRIKTLCSSYANEHQCKLKKTSGDWYRIPAERCPQNYGYNAIRLQVPESGQDIQLDFKGIAGDTAYHAVHTDKAGWRYGFVAVLKNSACVYGSMYTGQNGVNPTVTFNVPEDTQFLWLVVTGAPTAHWDYYKQWGELSKEKGQEAQWPYEVRLQGTKFF